MHRTLGPGLLESVYRDCMMIEMRRQGLRIKTEQCLAFDYKGERVGGALKLDLLVNDCIVVELKAVDQRISGRTPHELQFDDPQNRTETSRPSRPIRQ